MSHSGACHTILQQLLQVVRVTGQVEDECSSSNLLRDVLIQELNIVIYAINVGLLIQLQDTKCKIRH